MKIKIKIAIITIAIAIPICAIVVLGFMRYKLRVDHVDMETTMQSTLTEIEEAPDEIEYVADEEYLFYNSELSIENINEVVKLSGVDSNVCGTVSAMLKLYSEDIQLPWMIRYNQGYCDVFVMSFDGSDRMLAVTCYNGNYYVLDDTESDTYKVTHVSDLYTYSRKLVESLQYLLQSNTTWNWNCSECALIMAVIEKNYPGVNYDVYEGNVYLSNGVKAELDSGIIKFIESDNTIGTQFSLYQHLSSIVDAEQFVDKTGWYPGDTLNIVTLIDTLAEDDIVVDEDLLVQAFQDDLPMRLGSWSYDYNEGILSVYFVEYNEGYSQNIHKRNLFDIDTNEGTLRKYF